MRTRNLLPCIALCLMPLAANAQVPVPAPTEQAIAFHRELFWLWLLAQGMTFAALGGMVFTGWSASVTRRAIRWSQGRSWVPPRLLPLPVPRRTHSCRFRSKSCAPID